MNTVSNEPQRPLGVSFLGGMNCFVLGGLFFAAALYAYLRVTPQELQKAVEIFKENGLPMETLTHEQFKLSSLLQMGVSLVFLASGAGLLLRKEWARRTTVYFSFLWAVLICMTVVLNPAALGNFLPQIIYIGTLIIYFTNKKIEKYFVPNEET